MMRTTLSALLLGIALALSLPGWGDSVDDRLRQRESTLDQADAQAQAAQQALDRARQRQQQGVEPLPGERTGIVGGHSRLNETYFQRQQQLERDVAKAQRRLNRADEKRNELRD